MKKLIFFLIINFIFSNLIGQTNKKNNIENQIEKMHLETKVIQDSISKIISDYNEKIKSSNDSINTSKLNSKLDDLWSIYDGSLRTEVENDLKFARINQNSIEALKLIASRMTRQEGMNFYDTYESVFQNFSEKIKSSTEGIEMREKLKYFKQSKKGSIAPEFSFKDINGENISLKDYKDKKYILIDFWASWCSPCRQELPYIKELYKKYGSKGFEIISITKDENLENWKRAILKEKIDVWKQISILENNNSIEKDYFVFGIPHKILIDKNGVIIGKWKGSGGKNQAELENLLKEKFETE